MINALRWIVGSIWHYMFHAPVETVCGWLLDSLEYEDTEDGY